MGLPFGFVTATLPLVFLLRATDGGVTLAPLLVLVAIPSVGSFVRSAVPVNFLGDVELLSVVCGVEYSCCCSASLVSVVVTSGGDSFSLACVSSVVIIMRFGSVSGFVFWSAMFDFGSGVAGFGFSLFTFFSVSLPSSFSVSLPLSLFMSFSVSLPSSFSISLPSSLLTSFSISLPLFSRPVVLCSASSGVNVPPFVFPPFSRLLLALDGSASDGLRRDESPVSFRPLSSCVTVVVSSFTVDDDSASDFGVTVDGSFFALDEAVSLREVDDDGSFLPVDDDSSFLLVDDASDFTSDDDDTTSFFEDSFREVDDDGSFFDEDDEGSFRGVRDRRRRLLSSFPCVRLGDFAR